MNEACDSVVIEKNYIYLQNNYAGKIDTPHVDCIQLASSANNPNNSRVTIRNNTLINNSDIGYKHRQGIIITGTDNYIKIYNNYIRSLSGENLINVYIYSTDDSIHIFNNTLVSTGTPRHLVYLNKADPNISLNKLKFMNNILFRDNNSPNNEAIKFENANASDLSNEALNHNLYYSNNASTALLRFSSGTVLWNSSPGNWEGKGRYGDPKFSTADSYQLDYNSAAKNGGKGILQHGVITDISTTMPRPYWNYDFDIGAFEIEDTQLKIGVSGLGGNYPITHSVQVFDTYWERYSSGNWLISTDQQLSSANFSTTGNSDIANINSLRGFQYKWLGQIESYPGIGTGLYKVSNDSSTAHFYIDLRDAVQGYSLNVHILYDHDLRGYKYYKNGSWDNPIADSSVVRIWDINDGNTHTNNLPSYWQKALIPLVKNNRPYLVWGPNDNMESVSSYQVYRKNGGLPLELILSVSPDTMEYQDVITLNTPPFPGHTLYYFVTATGGWISSNSDTVYYEAQGKDPGKAAGKFSPIIAYGMEQNYPNPFNPLTKVSFSIENEELVTIKVYDILGREVKTLINQVLLPGNHQVNFNGDNLSTGIYIYMLTSGNFSAIKKMQLLK